MELVGRRLHEILIVLAEELLLSLEPFVLGSDPFGSPFAAFYLDFVVCSPGISVSVNAQILFRSESHR